MWWRIDEVGKVRKRNLMLLQKPMSMGEIENLRKFAM
jgi:hypothetical protein